MNFLKSSYLQNACRTCRVKLEIYVEGCVTVNAAIVYLPFSLVDLLGGQLSFLENHCGLLPQRRCDINLAGFMSRKATSAEFSFEGTFFQIFLPTSLGILDTLVATYESQASGSLII